MVKPADRHAGDRLAVGRQAVDRQTVDRQIGFDTFVRENWSSLMSVGVAVSGTRVDAEDLVQTVLASAYPRWSRIRPENALAYVRRSILNAHVSRWRRNRGVELSVAEPPERRSEASTDPVEDRLILLPLVRELPPRQRAVLVLRYLCDLGDADIAQTLGISTITVRTQAHRALQSLRAAQTADPPTVLASRKARS